MIIYKFTNKINNKSYIGQTTQSLNRRINQHKNNKKNSLIHKAILKYGIHHFEIKQIMRANSLEELNAREQFCIRLYNCMVPFGYNLTSGGLNCIMSKESIQKTRLANLGKKHKPETIEKYKETRNGSKNGMYGRHHSAESKQLISNVLKSKKLSSWRKGLFGVPVHTEESKGKLSKFFKGRPNLKNRGKKRSEEFKRNQSKNITKRNQKKVKNNVTGEVLDTAKLLVHILDKPYSTIINMLNGTNPNKLDWEYFKED